MKQNIKNLIALSCMLTGSLMLGSCNDFLDKEPLDKVTATSYFNSDADLASFTIKQYDLVSNWKRSVEYGTGCFR